MILCDSGFTWLDINDVIDQVVKSQRAVCVFLLPTPAPSWPEYIIHIKFVTKSFFLILEFGYTLFL